MQTSILVFQSTAKMFLFMSNFLDRDAGTHEFEWVIVFLLIVIITSDLSIGDVTMGESWELVLMQVFLFISVEDVLQPVCSCL